jgi:hypothetical protein
MAKKNIPDTALHRTLFVQIKSNHIANWASPTEIIVLFELSLEIVGRLSLHTFLVLKRRFFFKNIRFF